MQLEDRLEDREGVKTREARSVSEETSRRTKCSTEEQPVANSPTLWLHGEVVNVSALPRSEMVNEGEEEKGVTHFTLERSP